MKEIKNRNSEKVVKPIHGAFSNPTLVKDEISARSQMQAKIAIHVVYVPLKMCIS